MNIEKFKPDETGKFSPLLYRFLKSKKAAELGYYEVWQMTKIDGSGGYSEHWRAGEIVIGRRFESCVSGRRLISIIGGARGPNAITFAFGIKSFGLRNITKAFWKAYARDGRCAWDPMHRMGMVGDAERFTTSKGGLTRTCNWCGGKFKGKRRVQITRIEYIDWKKVSA